MNEERKKSNATEKRYSKHLGKLFWYLQANWDYDNSRNTYSYVPVMVTSLSRRWGRGQFEYMLHQPTAENDWNRDYRFACSRFERELKRKRYIPVEPGNPNPPEYKENE